MTLDRRVRALGWLLRRATGPVATMPDRRREALRQKRAPGWATDYLNGSRAPGVTSTDVEVPGPAGPIAARVYHPDEHAAPLPLVVAFHGGGWMFGDVGSADFLCSQVAARTPAVVVSGTYRLAPEHPAPAAVEDAFAVARWAADHHHDLGADGRMAVLGESSGGTLAASVAMIARDRTSFPIALQALVYPITDLALCSPSLDELPDEPILSSADLRSYVRAYLGRVARPEDPYLSPLHAPDHGGLPPTLILGAEHDPLRDDSRRYAKRLRVSGVQVEHHELTGAPHGFFSFPRICRAAGPAMELLVTALRRHLSPERAGSRPATPGGLPARVVPRHTNQRELDHVETKAETARTKEER